MMNRTPEQLYLDLIKKTLSFTLWPEPPMPLSLNHLQPGLKRFMVYTVSKVLGRVGLLLAVTRSNVQEGQRIEGQIWPGYADTMIGLKRLDNLQHCIETVLTEGVSGDFIETGVWRGGACILMRAVLAVYRIDDRRVFVADSFEGLPPPDENKYPADKGEVLHKNAYLAVSRAEVENNFRKYGLLDDQVVFLQGWFRDTLARAPIESLSILRLDGDMYGSTMESLESLYPRLSKGGFCIVDDYALPSCGMAVDDYRKKHQIDSEMKAIDWTGIHWRKE